MSIQNNFPAVKPTLLLDFANTKELDPRITFTRASTATYYGTQTAVAEQNVLLQSQDFATTWTVNGTSVTSNTSTAPDSTLTADTVTEDTSNSFHIVSQGGLVNLSNTVGTMTLSVFAKLGTGTRYLTIGLSTDITTNNGSATFDLSAGTNTQTQNNGTWTSASATITPVAQGFYRCTLTVTTDSVGTGTVRIGLNSTSTPTSTNRGFGADYVGDGTSSIIVWGAQVEKRSAASAYTATTTQPTINYIPVLQTAASGVARFDHNPVTGESLGLLIEEQRTNLLTYSEQFDNAAWTKVSSSITTNAIVAPDGTLTGDKLVEDTTASSTHLITQSISFTSGTAYTYSIFAKQAEAGRYIQLSFPGAAFTSTLRGTFDLTSGTFQVTASATAAITSVGNGWYKCSITATATATASGTLGIFIANSSAATLGAVTYTGDGYSGLYIWGAQLEAGAFATSYIPTVASSIPREADIASMTGTNFSSWYNAAQGTLYSEASTYSVTASSRTGFSITGTSNQNRIQVIHGTVKTFIEKSGTTQYTNSFGGVTVTNNVASRIALAYANNNANGALNGVSGGVDDTVVELPVVTQANIGNLPTGTANILNGQIRKIAYYPIRLTNAQLQALTS
jgi:hypothetical protein